MKITASSPSMWHSDATPKNKGGKLYKRKYLTTNGRTKYHFMLIPQSSAGRSCTGVLTTKKGNVTYYYPSDYITVSGYAGNSK